jgi:hypothetical protein
MCEHGDGLDACRGIIVGLVLAALMWIALAMVLAL